MDKNGITKKQFILQTASSYINLLLGVFWLVEGIQEQKPAKWIIGIVFIAITFGIFISLFIQWRRNPVVDEERDKQLTRNFKDQMIGMGIVYGVITFGFLLAFGLVWLLT